MYFLTIGGLGAEVAANAGAAMMAIAAMTPATPSATRLMVRMRPSSIRR
jgi:hypothetical protein